MDKSRIGNAAVGKRSADIDRRMKRRIYVYVAAAVLLFFVWDSNRHKGAPPPSPTETGPLDIPTEQLPPRAKIDPARLAAVRDGTRDERLMLEQDAHLHVLEEASKLAYGDLDQLGLVPGDWQALHDDPAPHRGQPFWVIGTLSWLDTEVIDRLPYYRGEVIDADGNPWAFSVAIQPYKLEVGQVVKLAGFFVKTWEFLRPDGTFVTAPLLVGEEILESSFRMDPVTRLRVDLLDEVRDADLAQANRPLESLAFYELLSYVTHAPLETLFSVPPVEVQPIELLRDPDHWRGETVHVTGVLLYMKETPLGPRGENPLGEPFAWQLWVSDTRSGDAGTMLVMSLVKPEGVAEGDIVDVEGIFLRRFAFENKANRPRMVAVIPARSVTKFTPREDTLTPVLVKVIIGLVGAIVLLVALGGAAERRSSAKARGSRMRRKKKMLNAGEGQPPFPAAATAPSTGTAGDTPAPEREPPDERST